MSSLEAVILLIRLFIYLFLSCGYQLMDFIYKLCGY